MPTQREQDRAVKRTRLLDILDRESADALVLSSAASLAWYLDGARIHVSLAADPIVSMRVSRAGDELILSSNERARLVEEELPPDIAVREYEWYEAAPQLSGLPENAVATQLRAARRVLLPGELGRYRALSRDAAAAATDALFSCSPEWSERELAARTAAGLMRTGADPLVVLVSGRSREHYPHPLPTDAPLGDKAMLVVCARRDGMIVNLTRSVGFGTPDAAELDAEQRMLQLERTILDALHPGVRLSEVLDVISHAYPAAGFGADQWRRHHQGGAAGYAGRDPRATPLTADPIAIGQAFSWNPWVPGAKVEDTVLLAGTPDKHLIDVLSVDPRWPTTEIGGRTRPITARR